MKIKSLFFAFLLLLICCPFPLAAQMPDLQPLPVDPQLRYGKLSNGLTYYIRHNSQPADRADFFIAQNVGSILEEDYQRGLAHFLEHMAFDGTKNFPNNAMDEYIESVGMRGGENFNAYTSFDETVYMIMNAPVTRRGIVDSCLLILHDWSGFISLTDSAITKERGVIREEWRTRQDAQARIWEQQFPKIYGGNKYGERMPIGTIDVINNFKPDELRAYYKKWYRPDLQAVIVVGDINVDSVEMDIKKIFADIPAPTNPTKREYVSVADNDTTIVSIATDKEASNLILSISYKHEKMPKEIYATSQGLIKDYMTSIISTIINERFNELLQKADPPFIAAQAEDGDFMISKTKGAFSVAALLKEGEIKKALDTLVVETERVRQFGFTESEYDRARINVLKQYESAYNERDKQKNRSFTNEYVSHFTDGGYIPGIEMEYGLVGQIAPAITVSQVNQYAQNLISDKNIVITLTGPEKPGLKYPTEAQLLKDFEAATEIPVTAYVETVSNEPLIGTLPASGKIVSSKVDPLFGATVMELGNGARVVLKHTDFKKDEIQMTATAPGGSSLYGDKEAYNLKVFNDVINLGGLGQFSAVELNKLLAGKKVACSPSLAMNSENLNGSAAPTDIKTLFELIYLSLTAPRMDQEAYQSFRTRMISQLQNMELNPMVAFSDSLTNMVYGDNPRTNRLTTEDFNHISYDRIMEMYRERFNNADGFVFTFVGNLSIDSMKPLIEQYIASLPTTGKVTMPDTTAVPAIRKGEYTNVFHRELGTPKSSVIDFISGQMPYSLETLLSSTLLKQCLDLVYTEKIREAEGGTYGVQTSVYVSSFPMGQTYIQSYFDTDPDKREKMNKIVIDELHAISEKGPRAEDFKKSQDNMLKRHTENMQENGFWLNTLDTYYFRGFDGETKYVETLNNATIDKVRSFAKQLLDQGNKIEVVMEP